MQRKQQGFAAQGALILLVVVVLIVGAGYVVVRRQNSKQANSEVGTTTKELDKIIPVDGTPKSAVSEISTQVTKEIKIDDDSFKDEDNESKVDDSMVTDVEGLVHEKNL